MSRPAGVIGCVFVLVAGIVLGYAGQSAIAIGAPAKVSISAAVLSSSGGIGNAQPVRVQLQIGVVNTGSAEVRVLDSGASTLTASIQGQSPSVLSVPGGTSAELALDVAVLCSWPADLTLPDLLVEEPNGEKQALAITGAAALTEACGRGAPQFRPLGVDAVRAEGDRFAISLQSPTGRTVQIQRIRAGGVVLDLAPDENAPDPPQSTGGPPTPSAAVPSAVPSTPAPSTPVPSTPASSAVPSTPSVAAPSAPAPFTAVPSTPAPSTPVPSAIPSTPAPSAGGLSVTGGAKTTLRLEAPKTCPPEWLLTGLPSSVTAELGDGSTVSLPAGGALPAWLLRTSCAETPGAGSVTGDGAS